MKRPHARVLLRVAIVGVVVVLAVWLLMTWTGLAFWNTKKVPYTTASVTLTRGTWLLVDFGVINSSVGDDWVLVSEPDPDVLGEPKTEGEYLGEKGSTGGRNTRLYRFATVGPGTAVLDFEYRFRGNVPDDQAERKTAHIVVDVEPRWPFR
ncbi:hypothetical protein GCM10009785_30260 [Brooklawnia cerclae]|uniref:Uncharacterized protein n=1 Tax=Brooklawnia cerclae TaxID=349934 RepID=A0ABX0SE68_9ACTN|nr:hypothetical protein [Brooklawnia cerclae]NIH56683.1 hypothetical protein [Brooklawnia cerclae]